MIKLLGYNADWFQSHFSDFEIFSNFRSRNLMGLYSKLFEFIARDNCVCSTFHTEDLQLYNNNDEIITGNFILYKQKYIVSSSLIEEIFLVFEVSGCLPAEQPDYADHSSLMDDDREMFEKL